MTWDISHSEKVDLLNNFDMVPFSKFWLADLE